mgnify:CR=1 FL=1
MAIQKPTRGYDLNETSGIKCSPWQGTGDITAHENSTDSTISPDGILGYCRKFTKNLTPREYLDCPDTDDFYFDGDFTIMLWFYYTDSDGRNIHLPYQETDSTHKFTVAVKASAATSVLGIYTDTSWVIQRTVDVPWGTWVHLVWRRSGNYWSVCIDGAQAGTSVFDTRTIANYTGTIIWIWDTPYELTGRLDDMAWWRGTALSNSDISDIYNGGLSGHDLKTLCSEAKGVAQQQERGQAYGQEFGNFCKSIPEWLKKKLRRIPLRARREALWQEFLSLRGGKLINV